MELPACAEKPQRTRSFGPARAAAALALHEPRCEHAMSTSTIVFNESERIHDRHALSLLLASIFPDDGAAELEVLTNALIGQPALLATPETVAAALRTSLAGKLQRDTQHQQANRRRLEQVGAHEAVTARNRASYLQHGRFNEQSVWYPNPTKFPHPSSVYDTLPYARMHKLLDRGTPVISAGSCFATEIAYRLQERGYNYVVTERNVYDGGPWSMAPAAWGTIFNTPGFRQLVEKSFGLRKLPRLLWKVPKDGRVLYRDPFREEVEFETVQAYEQGYERHIDACRAALERAEVFVLTLGLTEIWKLKTDGSVLSRVPWRLSSSLVERQALSVEDNVRELQATLDTLRRFNPNVQFIVTVSPVPLQATWRGDESHVITASHLSKSTLRVAAEEFASRNSGVYYFPAFETVMYCCERPFTADERHVRRPTVSKVMRLFAHMFERDAGFAAVERAPVLQAASGVQRLLCLPDWSGDFAPAARAIAAYTSTFTAADPVELVLWLPSEAGLEAQAAYALVADAIRAAGGDPERGPAIALTPSGSLSEPDALISNTQLVLKTGSACEAPLLARGRALGTACCAAEAQELREYVSRARELHDLERVLTEVVAETPLSKSDRAQVDVYARGYRRYLLTGQTPEQAYFALRRLFCATNGRWNDAQLAVFREAYPPVAPPPGPSVLGEFGGQALSRAVTDLQRDGFHRFEARLSTEVCDKLLEHALREPCTPILPAGGAAPVRFDAGAPLANTYDFAEKTLLALPESQQLVLDPGFFQVAQSYLGCEPIFDLVSLWWTARHQAEPSSASAQLFHFDMDRLHFLKFFVYLTDVGPGNGPHCYVKGTHRELPSALLREGRYSDAEVARAVDLEQRQIVLHAPRGTIFAADTRGLHKGQVLEHGERLMWQLEYTSSLFGAPYLACQVDERHTEAFVQAVRTRRRTYSRFYV
jgi:hypothetical protein